MDETEVVDIERSPADVLRFVVAGGGWLVGGLVIEDAPTGPVRR